MARTIVTGEAGCLEQMQTTDEAQVHSQRLKFSFEQNRMKYQVSVAQVFFTLLYFFLQKKIFIDAVKHTGINCTFNQFADDTKLGRSAGLLEVRKAV